MDETAVAHIRIQHLDHVTNEFTLVLKGHDETAKWFFRDSREGTARNLRFLLRATPAADGGASSSLGFELALALLLVRLEIAASDTVRIATLRNPVVSVGDQEFPIARVWPWFDATLFAEYLTALGISPTSDKERLDYEQPDSGAKMYVFNHNSAHPSRQDDSASLPLATALAVPLPNGACATGIIIDGEFLIVQVGANPLHAFLAFVLEQLAGHPLSWIPYPTADPDERGLAYRGYVEGSPSSRRRALEGPGFGDLYFQFIQPLRTEAGQIWLRMATESGPITGVQEPEPPLER